MRTPVAPRILAGAGLAVIIALTAGSRLMSEGKSELAASDAAWLTRQGRETAQHARAAARAFVPGAAHVELARERLREVAAVAEKGGDVPTALFAWRALRSSYEASRPFSVASGETLVVADRAIERLVRSICGPTRLGADGSRCRKDDDSAALPEDLPPRASWAALTIVGALLTFVGVTLVAMRGFGRDGRIAPRPFRWAALLGVAGTFAWLGGVYLT